MCRRLCSVFQLDPVFEQTVCASQGTDGVRTSTDVLNLRMSALKRVEQSKVSHVEPHCIIRSVHSEEGTKTTRQGLKLALDYLYMACVAPSINRVSHTIMNENRRLEY